MRSVYCGLVDEAALGQAVTLCGWVHRRRDHGGVIFIDLRDREGLVQVVIDPDTEAAFRTAEQARSEYVLKITGAVRHRPAGTENAAMRSGQVEVLASAIEVLNAAQTPPFQLDEDDVGEDKRLRYRYLDIRRPVMQERLRLRSKVTGWLRRFMEAEGFVEVETPMMHPVAGGALARPFVTHHNALDMQLYLRIVEEQWEHFFQLLNTALTAQIIHLDNGQRLEASARDVMFD